MKIGKIALILLLLTYVSGTFSLQRLDIGITLDIRYVLIALYILVLFSMFSVKKNKILVSMSVSLIFLVTTLILYVVFQLISLTYTPDLESGIYKTLDHIFLIVLLFSTLLSISDMKIDSFYKVTSYFFLTLGFIYAFPIFVNIFSGAMRADVLLSGPNVTTRIIFFAICSSVYLYILTKKNLYIIMIILFFSTIVFIGSRGGFIAAISILIIFFMLKNSYKDTIMNKRETLRNILFVPIVIAVAILLYNPVMRVFEDRFISTTFSNGELYTAGRDNIYESAINLIGSSPFVGYGVDSFSIITGYVYPHNLILEMTLEIGVVGMLSFLVFLYYSLYVIKKWRKSKYLIFSLLPLYMILVQMFSGEFYDFRYYFLWIIPLLVKRND